MWEVMFAHVKILCVILMPTSVVFRCIFVNPLFNYLLPPVVVSEEPQSVSSPNYPEPYDDFTKIKYYFVAPYGYRVFLNLTDLALENAFDFLYIGSDLDLSSENAVEYLTGNSMELPFTFLSDSRALALKFETDSAIVDRGFYGSVYAISEEGTNDIVAKINL